MKAIYTWRYACLLVMAALVPAILQAVAGIALTGPGAATDGPFTIGALSQFSSEFSAGILHPRWVQTGNAGLGSPLFFFYPPGVYYLITLLQLVFSGLPWAAIVGLVGVLLRAAAILTCAVWLRQRYGGPLALVCGAVYALMPYIAFYNPQYRLAFAETSAAVIVPLIFLSVDLGGGNFIKTVLLVALSVFLLALFHLPSLTIVIGLVLIYAGLLAESQRAALLRGASVLCGLALALALAAFSILPALALLPTINAAALQKFGWQGFFLFRFRDLTNPYYLLLDDCLLIGVIVGVAGIRGTFEKPSQRALTGIFLVSVLLTLPLSWPVWKIFFPLQRVQFPWRFLLPASLTAAALLGNGLQTRKPFPLRNVAWVVAAVLCVASSGIFVKSDYLHSSEERTQAALHMRYADAPEYLPATAVAKGWPAVTSLQGRAAMAVSPCLGAQKGQRLGKEDAFSFGVSGCTGATVFPQFFFPGWTVTAEPEASLAAEPDPVNALIRVNVPPGTREIILHRSVLPQELWGWYVSLGALLIWVILAVTSMYIPHLRKTPDPQRLA